MFIHWQASLETGQPLIDAEHRLLVFLFRKLDVAIKTSQSSVATNHIINEVKRFVDFHFASEENVMRETNYPHILAHQAQHADLLAELGVLASKVAKRSEFPEDLLFFLNKWLMEHIAQHDRSVAEHVREAAVRPIAELAYREYLLFPGNAANPASL